MSMSSSANLPANETVGSSRSTTLQTIRSMTDSFNGASNSCRASVPSPWLQCTHPQGRIYFYHPELKILTVEDLRDPETHRTMMQKVPHYLDSSYDELEIKLFGLSLTPVPFDHLYVNHAYCVISYKPSEIVNKNVECMDGASLSRARRHYWMYLSRYPAHVPTPDAAVQEATDALVWYLADNLISGSKKSIVPFSRTECEELLRLLESPSVLSASSPSKTILVGWVLQEVYAFRFAESYGKYTEKQMRQIQATRSTNALTNRLEIHSPSFIQTLVDLIITCFFFTIPRTYLAHVKSAGTYQVRLANAHSTWNAYIQRLVQEYSNFLLIATVLLSATVSFLDVPNIDQGGFFACIVATLASLGSIIVGVFCIWKHQTNTTSTASFSYIHNAEHSPLGLQGHAMLLSLPPVLLVWAVIAFSVSILLYTIQGAGANALTAGEVWGVIGVFCLILLSVSTVFYSFSTIWKWKSPWRMIRLGRS